MKTVTTEKAFGTVQSEAEKIKTDAHEELSTLSPGDVVRQGDVYLIAVEKLPKTQPSKSHQLAIGTTQGSRHFAEGDCNVLDIVDENEAISILRSLFPRCDDQQFWGPCIDAKKPFTVTHPEHGDRTLPAGKYIVTHQRAYAEKIRRTMD